MKKIIPYLSIKTLASFLLLGCLSFHNTISINQNFTASANSATGSLPDNDTVIIQQPTESSDLPSSPNLPAETPKLSSALIIKAINPGYTVDGTRDVGEFIELQNTTDASLSLAGYSLRYVNSSGKQTTLLNFSEGSSMVGEFLLLRLARTENSTEADMVYTTTLAMTNAKLEVLYHDEVVDQICWSKDDDCVPVFNSKKPSILVRDDNTGVFAHVFTDYQPHYDAEHPALQLPPDPEETPPSHDSSDNTPENSTDVPDKPSDEPSGTTPPSSDVPPVSTEPVSKCRGIEFTEILSYYDKDVSEQFIELYNATDQDIDLNGCTLNYKKKSYPLSGKIVADGYFVVYPSKFTPSLSLTKNPSSSNSIELLDTDKTVLDVLAYPHGQKKSVTYAKFIDVDGSESWDLTYAATPGNTNIYQEFRTCPTGKVINPATGNCIKVTTTNTSSSGVLAECPAGKYRNPLTGRCKNLETATSEPKPCTEGYERNPETNRCRKIKAENNGAGYALVPNTYSDKTTFTALGIVVLLVLIGIIYILLQFRREIVRMARKICQRLYHIRKDLVARGISLHRHKKP